MATTFEQARHLLSRAGFGGRPEEIARLTGRRWEDAVDRVVDGMRQAPVTKAPAWVEAAPPSPRERRAMGQAFQRRARGMGRELKGWWFQEMVKTPSPLTEWVVLFWHNHFTSSLRKVKWPPLLYRQNLTFRRLGTRSFRDLLKAMVRDPAMIVYLDNQTNHRHDPNENFARELLELFTLGEGLYGERDIKEAARAFTGYRVNRASGAFRFARGAHDDGVKTFLGRTGRFDGEAIVDILLEQAPVAERIVGKLWRELVSPEVDERAVKKLAAGFRRSGWAIAPLLRALLTSEAFRDPAAAGRLIKSPVDLMVGTLRLFDVQVSDARPVLRSLRRLGQDLFDPPNVKGWPGGPAWITSNTLLLRQAMLRRALGSRQLRRAAGQVSLTRWLGDESLSPRQAAERARQVLTPIEPVTAPSIAGGPSSLIADLALDPTYQLK